MRTLEDVATRAKLNRQQKIGLKYYDDIIQRMSYEEAARIVRNVGASCISSIDNNYHGNY